MWKPTWPACDVHAQTTETGFTTDAYTLVFFFFSFRITRIDHLSTAQRSTPKVPSERGARHRPTPPRLHGCLSFLASSWNGGSNPFGAAGCFTGLLVGTCGISERRIALISQLCGCVIRGSAVAGPKLSRDLAVSPASPN